MIKKNNFIFLLLIILISSCSFDNKTGIWSGNEEEKKRISQLKERQNQIIDVKKIYSTDIIYSKEIALSQKINLSDSEKNSSWKMSSLNNQNFLGNIYLSGINNILLKKKIGKNKYSVPIKMASPIIDNNNIILSDDTGTIFNINSSGEIIWKKNIYKKIYKKIYKNLNFSIYKNTIYIADNIGFIYAISKNTGDLVWIKNHGVPLKSNIKISNNKIFLINQDNRILSLSAIDGSKIWDIRSTKSFIKTQDFLSLAVTKQNDVIVINSSGDLLKIRGEDGQIYWSLNTLTSILVDATDFFESSEVVIDNENIIFSNGSSFFSHNLDTGIMNWEQPINSVSTPIISKNNIFFVTENGYLIIMDKDTGKIISSSNILKILKKKKQKTKIAGSVMGSGKIYSVTSNGNLIVSSASTGQVESFKKIGETIISDPVISDDKLYILTKNSRILVFS